MEQKITSDFLYNSRICFNLEAFWLHFGSQIRQRGFFKGQNLISCILFEILLNLGVILAPFWIPKSIQNLSKIDLKSKQKILGVSKALQDAFCMNFETKMLSKSYVFFGISDLVIFEGCI